MKWWEGGFWVGGGKEEQGVHTLAHSLFHGAKKERTKDFSETRYAHVIVILVTCEGAEEAQEGTQGSTTHRRQIINRELQIL